MLSSLPTQDRTHKRTVACADIGIAGDWTCAARATNEVVVSKSAKCAECKKYAEFKPMNVHHC